MSEDDADVRRQGEPGTISDEEAGRLWAAFLAGSGAPSLVDSRVVWPSEAPPCPRENMPAPASGELGHGPHDPETRSCRSTGSPGDAAFERLYRHFLPMVIRYCRSRLRDREEAEETAHAVFFRLLERRPAVRSSFIGLLLGTARNMCAARLPKPQIVPDPPVETEDRPADELERQERDAALRECLDRLPEADRTLVVLYDGEGLTLRQIREVLGRWTALSTFARRLKAVRARLERCLKEKNIF